MRSREHLQVERWWPRGGAGGCVHARPATGPRGEARECCDSERSATGSALVLVLLIVAITAAIATSLIWQRRLDVERTRGYLLSMRADAYVLSRVAEAEKVLQAARLQAQREQKLERIPVLPPRVINNETINTRIIDAEARYNINNVQLESLHPTQTLLQASCPALDKNAIEQLSQQLANWISPNKTAIDEQFKTKAYLPAHREMRDISELRLLPAMTAACYQQLKTVLIALPSGRIRLNINTAEKLAFTALGTGLSKSVVEQIIAERQKRRGFQQVTEFLALPVLKPYNVNAAEVTLSSDYFILETEVNTVDETLYYTSLVQRYEQRNRWQWRTIWQQRSVP